MIKDLEERTKERKHQALDRNIICKVQVVAEKLGLPIKLDNDDAREEGSRYENGLLKITKLKVDAFPVNGFPGRTFVSTLVEYGSEVKFGSEDKLVTTYIPGDWERELDKLYNRSSESTKPTVGNYSEQQRREKAAKFGL